jgi:hypothetical protein
MSGFSEQGDIPNWDFSFGSVTGYRWWWWHVPPKFAGYLDDEWVTGGDTYSYLIGANRGEWTPGKIEAECRRSGYAAFGTSVDASGLNVDHRSPEPNCGCGFWAYFRQDLSMRDVLYQYPSPVITNEPYIGNVPTVKVPVLGVVEGSGRVIIGEKGFRSQYAQLRAVCLPEEAILAIKYWARKSDIQEYAYFTEDDFASNDRFRDAIRRGDQYLGGQVVGGYSLRDASDSEILTRLSVAEEVLNELYPGVKVCPDRASMMKQFPKDENYA